MLAGVLCWNGAGGGKQDEGLATVLCGRRGGELVSNEPLRDWPWKLMKVRQDFWKTSRSSAAAAAQCKISQLGHITKEQGSGLEEGHCGQ
jgi:hypothetical protein